MQRARTVLPPGTEPISEFSVGIVWVQASETLLLHPVADLVHVEC